MARRAAMACPVHFALGAGSRIGQTLKETESETAVSATGREHGDAEPKFDRLHQ